MTNKQQIQKIKTNIERTIQGLRTKLQEFTYEETDGFVRPNKLYSIYYTLGKDEIYLTGIKDTSNSKIIKRVKNNTLFKKYIDLKRSVREKYPNTTPIKPSESDYRIGEIKRYLTRIANDSNKPKLINTVNGSGLAAGRALLALLELNQLEDGSIVIPKALRKYMNINTLKIN